MYDVSLPAVLEMSGKSQEISFGLESGHPAVAFYRWWVAIGVTLTCSLRARSHVVIDAVRWRVPTVMQSMNQSNFFRIVQQLCNSCTCRQSLELNGSASSVQWRI